MSLESIVSELKQERDRINRAIAALDGTGARRNGSKATNAGIPARKSLSARSHVSRKHHLTAAGRKRLSVLMKKRWAERRRKASNGRKAAA
jgi:hypothetical protein